jgi:predicted 2-oxoglutarate/Fe(II)-dependent dioxygenase YbiX
MNEILNQLEKNQYVFLPGLLRVEDCVELTKYVMKAVEDKQGVEDDLCPTAESLYGIPAFEQILLDLLPHFEQATGRKLLPTYSYARLYSTGDELPIHTDRESCEISATVTLGFKGGSWPIYMGGVDKTGAIKIEMDVGDAVLYKGITKHHWREKFTEGEWQTQVFLHYVDANGPHASLAYDKRNKLNVSDHIRYWMFDDILNDKACDIIINTYGNDAVEKLPPLIGAEQVDLNVRNVKRVMLPTHKDIGGRLAAAGLTANHQCWQFDVKYAKQAEFLEYPAGGRYTSHIDTQLDPREECRKVTVLAFLNDDFKGGRFFIQDGDKRVYPPQKKGTVLAFPSFLLHGVEDVEEGTRYSVVCWLVGPFFK